MPEQQSETRTRHEAMIERICHSWGHTIADWSIDEDDRVQAHLGRWRMIEDDEDNGLFVDDEGELTASVVGALEYGNERVSFLLSPDDMDAKMEVDPHNIDAA